MKINGGFVLIRIFLLLLIYKSNECLSKNTKRLISNEFVNELNSKLDLYYNNNNVNDSIQNQKDFLKSNKLRNDKNQNSDNLDTKSKFKIEKNNKLLLSNRETFRNINSFNNLIRTRLSSLSSLAQNYEEIINFQIQKEFIEIKEIINSKIKCSFKKRIIEKKLENLKTNLTEFMGKAESSLGNIKLNLEEKIKSITENLSNLLNINQ